MGLNYNPAAVIQGLVMYMDITNPRSYSGSGNTVFNLANSGIAATIITGITYDNDNKKNLNFNGSSGYMFSNDTSMNFGSSDFTIQTTLKLNGLSNGFNNGFSTAYGSIICAGAALTNNSSIFYVSGTATSHYGLGLYNEPTLSNIIKNYNFQTNKIYNVTVTKNTSQIEFFVDGASIGTSSSSNAYNFTANGFAIGRWFAAGSEQYLKGNIYDLKAYNRALTNDEIVQNYNASKGRYITPENIVTNGLILNIDPANSSSYSGIGNTIYDLSGFGNTGTLTNGPTFSALNGGRVVFDGSNDYISIGTRPTLDGYQLPITLSGWFYMNNTSGNQSICGIYNGVSIIYNYLRIDAGTFRFFLSIDGALYPGINLGQYQYFDYSTSLIANRWYYFAVVVGGTLTSPTLTMYINNTPQTFSPVNLKSSVTLNQDYRIGINQSNNESLNGSVAKLLIYNRALSATEIQQNYNATKGRFGL